jgi:hypothetical protein
MPAAPSGAAGARAEARISAVAAGTPRARGTMAASASRRLQRRAGGEWVQRVTERCGCGREVNRPQRNATRRAQAGPPAPLR